MKNATNFQKNISFKKIQNSQNVLMFPKYVKKTLKNKYVAFTRGSKKGGMATCIVIYLKTIFVNTYTYLNNVRVVFLVHKSLMR